MHRHPPLVEPEEDRLRLDALHPETHEVRYPVDGIAVAHDAPDPRSRIAGDSVGELALPVRLVCEPPVGGDLGGGGAEADHGGHVLETAAPGAFLGAPDDEGWQPQAAAH